MPVPASPVPLSSSRPAGTVLGAVRRDGPVFRDQLARSTGLSLATVNRQLTGLLQAGLARERPDLAPSGAVGRPRVAVEVDPDAFGVLGLHVGYRRTTLAVADLRGRVLGGVDVDTPDGEPAAVLTDLTRRLRDFGARWPGREMLQVGVVIGGRLTAGLTRRRHPRAGWGAVPVAELVDRATDSDVVVLPQVEAMAWAHRLFAGPAAAGRTLYVYAREAVGAALASTDGPETALAGLGTIRHLPVGGPLACDCGDTGCLEASVGDTAVAAAAQRAGITARPSVDRLVTAASAGDPDAHESLLERGRRLGRGVALVRDLVDPDQVVLLGQAFTAYRPGLEAALATFAGRTVLDPLTPAVSPLGRGVQGLAACTAALLPVYADPLGTVQRREARRDLAAPALRRAAG